MSLRTSEAYSRVVEKAQWSHQHGRSVFHIEPEDVELARLYTYAYRSQSIGTFHATRVALLEQARKAPAGRLLDCLERAIALLGQLEAQAVDPVLTDFRAVISTFYFYDRWIREVMDLLEAASVRRSARSSALRSKSRVEQIKDLFVRNLEEISTGDGLYVTSDVRVPEQGTLIVPNLNIAIVPLVYGDHHSWNTAYLTAEGTGVAIHRHRKGAEIHLGFSPVKGRTILGNHVAELSEGYAMPIPPMTDHGFVNLSGHNHFVPFVFGSLPMGGWGVFFDVEPRPVPLSSLIECSLDSRQMNQTVLLERAIGEAANQLATTRRVLIPAYRAGAPETGGLELAVTRVGPEGIHLTSDHFRIVSIRRGKARVCLGQQETELTEHDHFGVPAGIPCHLAQASPEPLVILDAMMLPVSPTGTGEKDAEAG